MLFKFLMMNLLIFNLFLFYAMQSYSADLLGKISVQGETVNFEIAGQKNWDYDLKRVQDKNQTKIQLLIRNPDASSIQQIKNIENPFIKNVQTLPELKDGRTVIEFTLKTSEVETFDYLTDQPSKLIVDFYQSEAIESDLKAPVNFPKAEKKVLLKQEIKKSKKAVVKLEEPKVIDREPADVDYLRVDEPGAIESSFISKSGLYDGGDGQFTRFLMRDSDYKEESVIKSFNNYYIHFPILETEFTFWKKMKENQPAYEVANKKDDENKQIRLLKTLFDKKRYLVFQKTADWFRQKYPKSEYLEMLSFMEADSLLKLSQEEKSDVIYEQAQAAYMKAIQAYPDSILSERTSLMTGMLAVDKADYMSAIRHLSAHEQNKNYQNKLSKQYARLGLAFSFSKLNKLNEALGVLDLIDKESKDPIVLASSAVRRGDIYFNAKKYDDAIKSYEAATKKHDLVQTSFPSAFFNKMEAQFWTRKFKDSHQSAIDFTKNFTSHSFAPYALTRVGELLDIMGAEQSKSVGAYLETHFRYGDSPKTIVARLHLLSTRMKSMKKEELDETLKKMDDLASKSELENIDQFKTAMVADGFSRRQDYRRAIEILSEFFQQNPLRSDSKQVTQRIIRNVNDELKNLADKKQYRLLLKTYKEFADSWLKYQNRIDTDYLLGMAYEDAGAYEVANEKLAKTLEKLNKISGTAIEKEIRVNQYLPTPDSLQLKIAQNFYENKDFLKSYESLEKIKAPLQMSEEEQVKRVVLASQLYEQKGDSETAIRYLNEMARLWKGSPEAALPAIIRLAEMQVKQKNYTEALKTFAKSQDILLSSNLTDENLIKKMARSYLDTLTSQKQDDKAIEMLTSVVKKYEGKLPLAEERFQLGQLYYKKGEIKKAEKAWEPIAENNQEIWKKLSQEKLKQSNWDENYKKHLKRIPAMSQMEGLK